MTNTPMVVARLLKLRRSLDATRAAINAALGAIEAEDPVASGAFVTTAEGAAICGASQRTVQRWAGQGRVGTQRSPSGDFLVNARDLLALTDPKP